MQVAKHRPWWEVSHRTVPHQPGQFQGHTFSSAFDRAVAFDSGRAYHVKQASLGAAQVSQESYLRYIDQDFSYLPHVVMAVDALHARSRSVVLPLITSIPKEEPTCIPTARKHL